LAESICNEVLLSGGAVTVVGGVPEDDVINVAGPIDEIVGKLESWKVGKLESWKVYFKSSAARFRWKVKRK
jgi:hypothetical protein